MKTNLYILKGKNGGGRKVLLRSTDTLCEVEQNHTTYRKLTRGSGNVYFFKKNGNGCWIEISRGEKKHVFGI